MISIINPIFAQANNQASGAFFGLGFLFLALAIIYTVLWLYALFSAATRSDLTGTERVLWIVLLIFLPGIGTLLYFVLKGFGR
jgi:hypothetical protein